MSSVSKASINFKVHQIFKTEKMIKFKHDVMTYVKRCVCAYIYTEKYRLNHKPV